MESVIGAETLVFHKIAKILRFNLTVPTGFQNDIIINVTNNDYVVEKHIDFCNIQVIFCKNISD
jgi:hypothetical protein